MFDNLITGSDIIAIKIKFSGILTQSIKLYSLDSEGRSLEDFKWMTIFFIFEFWKIFTLKLIGIFWVKIYYTPSSKLSSEYDFYVHEFWELFILRPTWSFLEKFWADPFRFSWFLNRKTLIFLESKLYCCCNFNLIHYKKLIIHNFAR